MAEIFNSPETLISVIVPVFNVETYLRDCVASICGQSYTNIEVLLIDDGSSDSSAKICDEFAEKDSRIRVVHKVNGGLSDARNVGLDLCIGNYICFVDSDDVIHKDYLKVLFNYIGNASVCMCYFERFFGDAPFQSVDIHDVVVDKFTAEFVNKNLYDKKFDVNAIVAWNKLYKRDVWTDLRFPINRYHEDEFVIHQVLDHSESFHVVREVLYYYRIREGSITKVLNQKNITDSMDALKIRQNYYASRGWHGQFKKTKTVERSLFLNPIITSESFPQWRSYRVSDILKDSISVKMKLLLILKKLSPQCYNVYGRFKGWH